MYNTIKYFAFY